jgi:hypothetical protein
VPGAGVIYAAQENDTISFGSLWQRKACVFPSGALIRKQVLTEVGGYDESRDIIGVEDFNLWLRIALTGWRFVGSEDGLFDWTPDTGHLSGDDLKMARAELANLERIGALVNCSASSIGRLKRTVRIEYARNLVGAGRMDAARQLLDECGLSLASGFLRVAAGYGLKRIARVDVLKWLTTIDSLFQGRTSSNGCTVPTAERARCRGCGG